jgi:hypothetical protein
MGETNSVIKKYLAWRTLLLLVLFFFAFYLRFIFINKGPFHFDTLDLALAAQKTLDTFRLHYEHGAGYPLTVIFGAFFIFVLKFFGFPDPVFCINFMSVVMGACGVVLLFLLVEKLFCFRCAFFSAFLFSCFAPDVAISTFGKSLTLSICFSLASAYCMVRYVRQKRKAQLLFSALFLGFCMASRLSDGLMVFPLLCLLASAPFPRPSKIKSIIIFLFIAFLTGLFLYIPLLAANGLRQFSAVLSNPEQAKFLGIFSYVLPHSLQWILDSLTVPGLLFVIAGMGFMVAKRLWGPLLFLLVWFLVFQFFYGNISSAGPRYLVIGWVPLVIAQGYFLGSYRGLGFYLACFILLGAAFVGLLRHFPVFEFRHRYSLQAEFARWVGVKTETGSVIIALDEGPFIEYYGRRRTLQRPVTCDEKEMKAFFDKTLDTLLTEGKKIYMISSAMQTYDPCLIFVKMFRERYDMILIGKGANEDWHHALLNENLFIERLYLILRRRPPPMGGVFAQDSASKVVKKGTTGMPVGLH